MLTYAGDKLAHLHIADCYNHRANVGNRYIVNPSGVDARVHQHNEIGNGDLDWDEFFGTLRDIRFDGVATVCVFGEMVTFGADSQASPTWLPLASA